MKKKIIILFVFLLLFIPTIVFADIIIPGTRSIGYCFEISNIDDYPDYSFQADFALMGGDSREITQGQCIGFYKFDTPQIYAIDAGGNMIPSSLKIHSISSVWDEDPRDKIVDVLTIISITNNGLQLEKTKVIYTYLDGTTEEIYYQDQNIIPEPSQKYFLPWWLVKYWGWAALLTIIIEFLIIWAFLRSGPIKSFITALIVNLITIPIANYFYKDFFANLFLVEFIVFIAEVFLLMLFLKLKFTKAILISFIANLVTALISFYFLLLN